MNYIAGPSAPSRFESFDRTSAQESSQSVGAAVPSRITKRMKDSFSAWLLAGTGVNQ